MPLEEIIMTGVKELKSSNAFYRCVSLEKMVVGTSFAVSGSVLYFSQNDASGYTAKCDVLVYGNQEDSTVNVQHSGNNFGFTGKIAYYDADVECSNCTWRFDKYGNIDYMSHEYVGDVCLKCSAHKEKGLSRLR